MPAPHFPLDALARIGRSPMAPDEPMLSMALYAARRGNRAKLAFHENARKNRQNGHFPY